MLLEAMGGEYEVCRIPGMVATSSGALVAYYECRRGSSSDWAQIDIKIIRSEDGGESFSTVMLIAGEGSTLNNPVMIADGETLHFLYCKNYYNLYYSKSEDGGKSFGVPREITECLYEAGREFTVAAVGPGHGIVKNGRLIVPVWFAYNPEKPKSHHPSFISTLYSDDGGESFHVGEVIGDGILKDPSECALALTADGRVMNSIRNENPEHLRALAYSENGSDGWTLPELCENLPDPICQGSMLSDGGLVYHINCASKEDRLSLSVKISADGFRSMETVEVDEVGGYSDIALLDGKLCVIYEKLSRKQKEGLFFKRLLRDET